MKCIPGGKFIRGSNRWVQKIDSWRADFIKQGWHKKMKDEAPEQQIDMSTYFLDTYEVTYGQFQECIKAGKCRKEARPHYRWVKRKPKAPMLGMNWYDARDYCLWRGRRLPSEAEWEKAARGPNGDKYPWGNAAPDCKKAIFQYEGKRGCGTKYTWNVGSMPAGHYGLYDMAGNAHEWVNDWYAPGYDKCGKACMGKDPKGPCDGKDNCPGYKYKIVKGGSWYWQADKTLASWRRPHTPQNEKIYHHFGFRCAMSPMVKK